MTIGEAVEIKKSTNLLSPLSNYQWERYHKAEAFIEAWNAAVQKCANVAKGAYDKGNHSNGPVFAVYDEILKLSTTYKEGK